MFKSIALVASCAAAAFAASSAPRTVYSPQQLALPIGHSLKTTPDPANIWSWHETHSYNNSTTTRTTQVLVDINGDGQMDSMDPHVRVLITDIQVAIGGFFSGGVIRDDNGSLWEMRSPTSAGTYEAHLMTPIVVPVGSQLWSIPRVQTAA